MDLLVPSLVALIASSAAPAANAVRGGDFARPTNSPAMRHDNGSSATATISARIIRNSARIGAQHAPPLARMVPRPTTVSAADGRLVAALVYDFE